MMTCSIFTVPRQNKNKKKIETRHETLTLKGSVILSKKYLKYLAFSKKLDWVSSNSLDLNQVSCDSLDLN